MADVRALGLALLLGSACGPVAAGGPCQPVAAPVALPAELSESSGVAASLRHPGVYWTHNDAGSLVAAVDAQGRIRGSAEVPFAFRDWEDLALAPCGDGAHCLWAADVGDNYEERGTLFLVRFPEPDPDAPVVDSVTVFPLRLPDGSRDVETLLVLPGARLFLVTKGRNHPVTVYRYPGPPRADTVVLEEVQRLSDGPRILPRQITGGAVGPGGVVVLRSYQALRFYRVESDTLVEIAGPVNLRTLDEAQGEGVGMGPDGRVVLTSETGPGNWGASLALLDCRLEG